MDDQEVQPKKPRKQRPHDKKAEQKALHRQVAALHGMGMSQREIGKKVGRYRQQVAAVIHGPIAREPELQAIVAAAKARLGPQAVDIAEKLLHKIRDSVDGVETVVGKDGEGNAVTKMIPPPLREQASALREVAAVAGITRDAPPWAAPAQAGGVSLNFSDAATMASFVEALRLLNEPKTIDVTPEDAG
jgi:hypothetical protein